MKPTYLLLASLCFLSSCQEKKEASVSSSSKTDSEEKGILQSVVTATPKGSVATLSSVRVSAKPGDEVTLKGRIIGNVNPFVAGRSAFILADPEILSACNDKPGDECDTPWDSCCYTAEEKKKGTATIQIVNSEGRVLKEPIENVKGISKLATITVSGNVAKGSSAELLIVNATAIHADQ